MLLKAFADRTVKVLVVEESAQIRAMMQDVLRGFGHVARTAESMNDAVFLLESERFDWVLMPPAMESKVNCLHLLGLAIKNPHWRQMRVSLLLPSLSVDVCTKAMSLGCLSWHVGPFTRDVFSQAVRTLMERIASCDYQSDLVSATYVREFSFDEVTKPRIIDMENALIRLRPGNYKMLLEAADSCRKIGSYLRALLLLTQARLLETSSQPSTENLYNTILTEMSRTGQSFDRAFTSQEIFGFESVAIIEPDGAMRQLIASSLSEVADVVVHSFCDGQAFMDWYESHDVDVVLMEWRLPILSGVKVLQRIVNREAKNPPRMVLTSSSLGQTDMPLLKELGVAAVVSKPLRRQDIMAALLKTNTGALQPAELYFEQQIRGLIRAKKIDRASELSRVFIGNPHVSEPRKMLIQADLFLFAKKYELARDLCLKAMTSNHDVLYALQILGKCFMGLRQFEYATKCFDKAQFLSPMNIERLCLMAISEAEQGHYDKAHALVEEAQKVDAGHEMVLDTSVNVALVQGDLVAARKGIAQLPNIMAVVAFQNNRAVSMAKTQRFKESIDVYKKTIEVLPSKAVEANEIIHFNLALAYIKINDVKLAGDTLNGLGDKYESRVRRKIEVLRRKVSSALTSGQDVTLATDDSLFIAGNNVGTVDKQTSDDHAHESLKMLSSDGLKLICLVDFRPGDLGCFNLFMPESGTEQELAVLLNSLPHLRIRWKTQSAA